MRKLWLVVVVGLAVVGGEACGRKRVKIVVPNTPEGSACQRECMVVFHSCQGGRGRNAKTCQGEADRCFKTCPGAMYENGEPIENTGSTAY